MSPTCRSNQEVAFPVAVPVGEKLWPKVKYQRCTWQDHLTPHSSSKIQIPPYPILFLQVSHEDQPTDNISQDTMTSSDFCPVKVFHQEMTMAVLLLTHEEFEVSWVIRSWEMNFLLLKFLHLGVLQSMEVTSVFYFNNEKRFAENKTKLTVLEQMSRIRFFDHWKNRPISHCTSCQE